MTSPSLPTPDATWTYLHSFGHTVIARADKVPCEFEPPYKNLEAWQFKHTQAPLSVLLGWGALRGIIPGTYGLVFVDVDHGDPTDLIAMAPPLVVLKSGTPGHYHLVYRGMRDFANPNFESMGCRGQLIHNHFVVLYGDNAQRLLQAISSSNTAHSFPDDLYARVADPQPPPHLEDDDHLLEHLDLPTASGANLRYHRRENGMFHIVRPYAYDYIRAHYRPHDPNAFSMTQFYWYMHGLLTSIHSTIPYSQEAVEGCGDNCNKCASRPRPDVAILPKYTIRSTAKSTTQWSWAHRDELVGHIIYRRPPTTDEQSRRGVKSGKVRRAINRDRDARIVHAVSQGRLQRDVARGERVSPSTVCRVVRRVTRAVRDDMEQRQPHPHPRASRRDDSAIVGTHLQALRPPAGDRPNTFLPAIPPSSKANVRPPQTPRYRYTYYSLIETLPTRARPPQTPRFTHTFSGLIEAAAGSTPPTT